MSFQGITEMFKAPEIPNMNVTLIEDNGGEPQLKPRNIDTKEGTFVENKEETAFMKALQLKPKLLTSKPPPTKRKKKDEDSDYQPSQEDLTEDDDLDNEVVQDPPPKSTYVMFYIINKSLFWDLFPYLI